MFGQAAFSQHRRRALKSIDRPVAERGIGEVPHVAAVAPLAQRAASRARRRNIAPCAGADRHDSIGYIDRDNQHIGQLW
ncbi:hypothetical protein [Streptomyces sp. NPDC005507]|uniref:hypothetical protein n=1 Tax=Streptomyces sp. NPDC005507 TaxID=3154885 RepID=UPI0033B16D70